MIGKLDQHFRFNETALSLRAQRQQILASNIANADTPNFKARDFNFKDALEGALSDNQSPNDLKKTSVNHLNGTVELAPGGVPLQYRGEIQGNIDGNTVDMDVERNQFTDNALRYEAAVTMVNSQIRSLMTAISGGQ